MEGQLGKPRLPAVTRRWWQCLRRYAAAQGRKPAPGARAADGSDARRSSGPADRRARRSRAPRQRRRSSLPAAAIRRRRTPPGPASAPASAACRCSAASIRQPRRVFQGAGMASRPPRGRPRHLLSHSRPPLRRSTQPRRSPTPARLRLEIRLPGLSRWARRAILCRLCRRAGLEACLASRGAPGTGQVLTDRSLAR